MGTSLGLDGVGWILGFFSKFADGAAAAGPGSKTRSVEMFGNTIKSWNSLGWMGPWAGTAPAVPG